MPPDAVYRLSLQCRPERGALSARHRHRRGAGAAQPAADRQRRGAPPGEKIAILNFGTLLPEAAQAAEALNATLVDMRFVKPLDEQLVLELAASHETLVTLEENAIMGGAGSGVNELLMAKRRPVPVLNLGLPDSFVSQGTRKNCAPTWGWTPPAFSGKSKPGWRSNRHSRLTKRLRLRGVLFPPSPRDPRYSYCLSCEWEASMKYLKLGNTDLNVSRICLGCMTYGEPNRGNHAWTLPEESSRPLLKQALEAGINFSTPPTAIPTAAARKSSAGRCATMRAAKTWWSPPRCISR